MTYVGQMLEEILVIVRDPHAWAALVTLVVMEVVLGIDNLVFISILTNKLPEHQRSNARRIGIGVALILRLGLLGRTELVRIRAVAAAHCEGDDRRDNER